MLVDYKKEKGPSSAKQTTETADVAGKQKAAEHIVGILH
jgi:hypothetical protein